MHCSLLDTFSLKGTTYYINGSCGVCNPVPHPGSYFQWCQDNGSRGVPLASDLTWVSGQPNNKAPGIQFCLVYNAGLGLNDADCTNNTYQPICEVQTIFQGVGHVKHLLDK